MDHATWTARDGAPQGILALAQDPEGTLWIGSESGLHNFDGRTFTEFRSPPGDPELPTEPIYALFVAKDGTLWVGFLHSGVAHIALGRVTLYTTVAEKPLGRVDCLKQAADGSIWATSNGTQLMRFGPDLAWHAERVPQPGTRLTDFFIDSSNTLWVPQGGRLYRRPLDQSEYTATDVQAEFSFAFAEAPDGSIWMNNIMPGVGTARTVHIDPQGKLLTTLPGDHGAADALYAPDGSLILATSGDGLRRYRAADLAASLRPQGELSPDDFKSTDGLTSDIPSALLLDADGNIWVGGRRGLDRFRKARLVRFFHENNSRDWFICAGKPDSLWIASNNRKLYRRSGDTTVSFESQGAPRSLSCTDDGGVWVLDSSGIRHVRSDRIKPIPDVPGATPYSVLNVASTSDHTLYAMTTRNMEPEYWQYRSNRWTQFVPEGLQVRRLWSMYVDPQDRLWVGHRDGWVSLPLEGREFFTGLGPVRTILTTSHGVLAAGANGLAVFRDNRFEILGFADERSALGTGGIVESRNGDLWLNAMHGIVRVSASELDTALSQPGYRMKSDLLAEGIFVGSSQMGGSLASAARDTDGMLWFCTFNGIVRIDPDHWHAESRPPRVSIRSIAADMQPMAAAATIDPRPQALEIRYFGVNLTAPDQVIYRYRLEGFDKAWQNVGHRTEAIYTRLPAGSYTFNVSASNGDGVWTSPVSMAFAVLPSFYQTTWFAAICILTALAVVCLALMARIRTITREVHARAEERADERIRIARELHDTLLQGIQGLLLNFHVATQKLSPDDGSKMMLEKALATADRIIIEGRNRVSRLRSEHLSDAELVASLENVCNELTVADSAKWRVSRQGDGATLHAHVADEIFYVARESLTNAFRHSQASEITLELIYGKRYFTMRSKDDGRGFEPAQQDMSRHWGLKGMAERVEKLGGMLRCTSTPQQGTEIHVSIPSYKAYPGHSRLMFYLRALGRSR